MAKNHARWDTPPPQNAPKPKGPLVHCRFYNVATLRLFPDVRQVAATPPHSPPPAGCSGGPHLLGRPPNPPGLETEPLRALDLPLPGAGLDHHPRAAPPTSVPGDERVGSC